MEATTAAPAAHRISREFYDFLATVDSTVCMFFSCLVQRRLVCHVADIAGPARAGIHPASRRCLLAKRDDVRTGPRGR